MDIIKIKNVCASPDINKKVVGKTHGTGESICTSCILWHLYEENIKSSQNSKLQRQITQLKKWPKDLNAHFSKEVTQMSNKQTKDDQRH